MLSQTNVEDIDTKNEDHVYDDIGLLCNHRKSFNIANSIKHKTELDKHLDKIMKQTEDVEYETYEDVQ
jgi:hypothetical protein